MQNKKYHLYCIKKILSLWCIAFLLCRTNLNGESIKTLTFGHLANALDESAIHLLMQEYHGKEVVIRGFLYPSQDGNWVLSSEPNLKTCCVGSAVKAKSQILVETNVGELSKEKVVSLHGIFFVDSRVDDEGNTLQYLHLKNASLIDTPQGSFTAILLVCLAVSVILLTKVWIKPVAWIRPEAASKRQVLSKPQ